MYECVGVDVEWKRQEREVEKDDSRCLLLPSVGVGSDSRLFLSISDGLLAEKFNQKLHGLWDWALNC